MKKLKLITVVFLQLSLAGLLGSSAMALEKKNSAGSTPYSVLFQGISVGKHLMQPHRTVVKKSQTAISRHGRWSDYRRWKLSFRGGVGYPSMNMEATAYDPGPISCGPNANGYTATGMKAGYGVVAVDPRVIPLGTKVYVEGYGYAIAADIGGAIKGNRIDLCYNTYQEAIRFGRRMVRVYLLGR